MEKKPIDEYVSVVYPFLEKVLYSIAIYRTILQRIEKITDCYEKEFWTININNAIQMAIIDWCKVFGSEWENEFHCKKHIELEIDKETKDAMVLFRNKFIAHKEDVKIPVPILDGAMNVIYKFDDKVRTEYRLDGYPELKNSYEAYVIRMEDCLQQYKERINTP